MFEDKADPTVAFFHKAGPTLKTKTPKKELRCDVI